MAGNIIGDPVRDYVDEQIDLRQKIQGAGYANNPIDKSPKVINYLNNRSAWIKMASGVSISGSAGMEKLKTLSSSENNYITESEIENLMGSSLAKNVILFNTAQSLSKFAERNEEGIQTNQGNYRNRSGVRTDNTLQNSINKMYGGLGGNSRGLQPVPGITDISIECINRGSIRKAVVNLKAYNKFQFSIIEILYLRLGYIMMLEWGWDKYISGFNESTNEVEIKNTESTIIENEWFKTNGTTQSEMIKIIDGYRALYKGNYDGFFGKVNNFNWTLNRDNTYDITINLITMGSVIESLQVNLPAINITLNKLRNTQKAVAEEIGIDFTENSTGEIEFEENDNIASNLGSDVISQFISNVIINIKDLKNSDYIFLPDLAVAGALESTSQQSTGTALIGERKFNFNTGKIPLSQRYYIRLGEFLKQLENILLERIQNENSKTEGVLKFDKDIELTLCNYVTNLIPVSPSKVIFSFQLDRGYSEVVEENAINKFNDPLNEFVVKDRGVVYGQLMNCYLNLNFILEALNNTTNSKEVTNLYRFLEVICDGINESTGNVTNIEPAIKEDKTIYFLEQNPIKGYDSLSKNKPRKETEIEAYGYNSIEGISNFVKDFSFQTKITPDLLTMISISATAGESNTKNLGSISLQNLNVGLNNRFQEKIINTNSSPLFTKEEDEKNLKENFKSQIINGTASWGSGAFTKRGFSFNYKGEKIGPIITSNRFEVSGQTEQKRKKAAENEELLSLAVAASQEFDKQKADEIKIQTQKLSEQGLTISENVLSNYGFYLSNAFGGIPKVISKEGGELLLQLGEVKRNVPISKSKWWYLNSNSDFTSQGKNSLKLYVETLNKKQYEEKGVLSNNLGFIPLDLGITFDGLSGIRIYDKININTKFLPSQYPNNIKFVATKVNHKVSENIWETSISTLSTPKTEIPPYDTEYENQSKDQKIIKNVTPNILPSPFAEALRSTLRELGYSERSKGYPQGELSSGGDITSNLSFTSQTIFREIKKELPDVVLEITGGNDVYHQQVYPNSRHTKGNALDFILIGNTATPRNIERVSKILEEFDRKGKISLKDEYAEEFEESTGKHFHISL